MEGYLKEHIEPIEQELKNLKQIEKNNEEWNKQNKIQYETLLKMYESMDAKSIADHQAEIDEKKFWCN